MVTAFCKLLLSVITVVTLSLSSFAQEQNARPQEGLLEDCFGQLGFFYCTPEQTQLNQAVQANRKGYCCQESELINYSQNDLKKCTAAQDPLVGIQCSNVVPDVLEDFTPAQQALFSSYSLGLYSDRTQACAVLGDRNALDPDWEVTGEVSTLSVSSGGEDEDESRDIETCYWILRPMRDIWVSEASEMVLSLSAIEGGQLYALQGTQRANSTDTVIENGQDIVIGAPLVLDIDNDLILLFTRTGKEVEASFTMEAEIFGREYPWWEKPFIGKSEALWYIFLIGVPVLLLILIVCLFNWCCSCCCPHCCKCMRCKCCCCNTALDEDDAVKTDMIQMMNPNSAAKGAVISKKKGGKKVFAKKKNKTVPSAVAPAGVVSKKKGEVSPIGLKHPMKDIVEEYGEESEGPIPPTPPHAVKSPRPSVANNANDKSLTNLLSKDQHEHMRVESMTEMPQLDEIQTPIHGDMEERLKPSTIFKKTPGSITPLQAVIAPNAPYQSADNRQVMESYTSQNRTDVTGFPGQERTLHGSSSSRHMQHRGNRGSVEKAKVLFDEEAADRFEKENSFNQIDGSSMYNPDEEGIDPVTIYRFQENTRRLDRLRAELSGQPIAPGSRGVDDQPTLDPDERKNNP